MLGARAWVNSRPAELPRGADKRRTHALPYQLGARVGDEPMPFRTSQPGCHCTVAPRSLDHWATEAGDIIFNCKISMCMAVGCKWKVAIRPMLLSDVPIPWVNNIKYLGIVLVAGASLHVDWSYIKRKFYSSCNAVLSQCKYADEFVRLSLVRSMCLPLLTYCLGALDLPQYRVQDLGVCWNNCFRKIFHLNQWESVSEIQHYCGLVEIYGRSRTKFLLSLDRLENNPGFVKFWTTPEREY